ncbi:hypothetical protein H5410_028045 [Solanum commersonii]|uniref:Protein kinase domain-containing protein n=1 Tax=Solanum commersonii TaxID=4109 RepID=A0A9J5Z0Y8_SOLCO|nr:hypothetical protein H5410_028045 [Solanum commersonii]
MVYQMDLIAKLRHPYMVEYKDDWVEKGTWICIVTNYCEGGEMAKIIRKSMGALLPEEKLCKWLTQLLLEVDYLHSNHVLHRDVKTVEIVLPELHEMHIAHIVSIGSESLCTLNPDCGGGKGAILTNDTRTDLTLLNSFTAADYVAAQRLRRRLMYFHIEIFEKVDIIVTPTTRSIPITISYISIFISMTPPRIPPSAIKVGETDLQVSGVSLSHLLPDIINYGLS